MRPREAVYAVIAVLGLAAPWYFNLRYVTGGGSAVDVVGMIRLAFANPISSSLSADVTIAYLAFAIWAPLEAQRIGMRRGWLYSVLGLFIAVAFALPLFLFQRERHLRRGTVGIA